jgi:hypothetical protein
MKMGLQAHQSRALKSTVLEYTQQTIRELNRPTTSYKG